MSIESILISKIALRDSNNFWDKMENIQTWVVFSNATTIMNESVLTWNQVFNVTSWHHLLYFNIFRRPRIKYKRHDYVFYEAGELAHIQWKNSIINIETKLNLER